MAKAQQKKIIPPAGYADPIRRTPVNTDSLEAMTLEKDYMVTGQFKNLEQPGQPGYIGCRLYKHQPMFSRWFLHDEVATIPYSVAKFINTRTHWTKYDWTADGNNGFTKVPKMQVQRYQFVSKDFG